MIDLVSLAFPLLLVSFVLWRFPVQPDRYVSDCAEIPVRATVGSQGKSEISTQAKIVYWVISIGCGTLIGIGQLLLFRLDVSQSSDYIFESRMLDSVAYPFLPGMVVGLFCGMVLCFHLIKGYGTHYLIGSLRKTWNGISLGAWYSKANIMGSVLVCLRWRSICSLITRICWSRSTISNIDVGVLRSYTNPFPPCRRYERTTRTVGARPPANVRSTSSSRMAPSYAPLLLSQRKDEKNSLNPSSVFRKAKSPWLKRRSIQCDTSSWSMVLMRVLPAPSGWLVAQAL